MSYTSLPNPLIFLICIGTSANALNLEPEKVNSKSNGIDAVFLGDSLTAWWEEVGVSIWNANYANFSANFGQQGFTSLATMNQILNEGILDGLTPKVVVLLTGGNDLAEFADGETVGNRIATLVDLIQQNTPNATKILLIAITPAGGMPEWIVEQGLIANARIAAMDNGNTRTLDMRTQFSDENGNVYPELYQFDLVHFSAAGYAKWHETMGPLFRELISS